MISKARAQQLIGLFGVTGFVRADFVRQQWQQFTATHTVKQSLEQIMDNYLEEQDFNKPDAKPTSDIGKFMQMLQSNMSAATSADEQTMIRNAVGNDVNNFIDQQASYILTNYSWQGRICGHCWRVAEANGTVRAASGSGRRDHRRNDHLFRPDTAGAGMAAAAWSTACRFWPTARRRAPTRSRHGRCLSTENHSYLVPVTDLINVKQDGTGAALGQAILGKLATTDGMDKYRLQEFQSYYQSSLDAANKDAGKIEGRQSFDNFNANLHPNLQTVFDSIVKGSGDLYTKAHPFGNDPASDNEYGKRLGLTPDVTPPGSQTNPGANLVSYNTNGNGSGTVALYTDPAKLAKIHELKQIDLLSQGLNLPLDIATITTMIANGQDPLRQGSPPWMGLPRTI